MSIVIPERTERKYGPYSDYQDSGVEWLGQIPVHWDIKKIKWDTPVFRGASPRPIDDPVYFDDEGEYAWVRIADVTASGTYLEKTTQRLSELGASLSVKMKPGELFLSIAGSVGKPCITKIKCCIHDGFVYFPRRTCDTKFLYYIFASGEPYKGLGKLGTQLNLNTDTVASIYMGFPPSKEQQAIADFIDRETTRIDELIAKKQRLIDLLQEQRTALITHAVTKGLNQDVPMKYTGVEWLGEIPAHWDIKKLKYVAEIVTGNTPPKTDPENYDEVEGLPWIKPDNLGTFLPVLESQEYLSAKGATLARVIPKEAVLTCCIGSIGSIGVAGCELSTNQQINSIIFIRRAVHPKYGLYMVYASSPEYLRLANLNVVAILNSQSQKTILIPLPPIQEQQAITDYLDKETSRIDNLVSRINQAIEKLQEYRSALITAAVTGKIDVRQRVS